MSIRLGFDIGGTFTDLFAVTDDGELIQEKVPTTPGDFSQGAQDGIVQIADNHDIDLYSFTYLSHGTTVATNAVIEREGATTGLITTKGFRDILAIGREKRHELYETSSEKTPAFTERRHRRGVAERMDADGSVVTPLDEEEVAATATELVEDGIESIAVAFLNAYRNPEHERTAAEVVRETTDLPVSQSSGIMSERREYERTLSTVINAYVEPVLREYLNRLQSRLTDLGIDATLNLMQANGGIITPGELSGRSLRLINSGPAAGTIGAKRLAGLSGIDDVITLDVGGTSADACVVRNGEIETTTRGEIDQIPLQFQQIDIRTVGAGGGSIAWATDTDVVKVGPQSAGATPGPACYGRGGTEPTVTDAAVVLGYLNPDYLLGGEMELDKDAGEAAISELADRVGLDPLKLADGVLDIATTNMAQTVRLVTVEKGYDPREFALCCYGGAGPLFGTRLADHLDINCVLVPAMSGVLSASGLLTADRRIDVSQSRVLPVSKDSVKVISETFQSLEEEARDLASDEGSVTRTVDLRYVGQTFQLNVPVPSGSITTDTVDTLRSRFLEKYEGIYGQSWGDEPIEAVTWRVELVEETPDVDFQRESPDLSVEDAKKGTRQAFVGGEFCDHTVFDRYQIPHNTSVSGPAIIEAKESTTYVDPNAEFTIDEHGNLIVTLD